MSNRHGEICALLDVYAPLLSDSCRRAVELYYFNDLSLSEIAEDAGISRQGAHDAIKRGESELFRMEEALGVLKKSRLAAECAAKIISLTDDPAITALAETIQNL